MVGTAILDNAKNIQSLQQEAHSHVDRTRSSHGNGLLGRCSQADSDVVISYRIVGRSDLRHYIRRSPTYGNINVEKSVCLKQCTDEIQLTLLNVFQRLRCIVVS